MRKIGLLIMAVFMLLLASCAGNKGYKIYKEDQEKALEVVVDVYEATGYDKVKADIDWGSKEVVKVEEDDKVVYFYKVEYTVVVKASDNKYNLPDEEEEMEVVDYFTWVEDEDYVLPITEDVFEAAKEK